VTAVGMFAGRGDVVLAMGVALILGLILGWKAHGLWISARARLAARKG
jgi:hypothetical protein